MLVRITINVNIPTDTRQTQELGRYRRSPRRSAVGGDICFAFTRRRHKVSGVQLSRSRRTAIEQTEVISLSSGRSQSVTYAPGTKSHCADFTGIDFPTLSEAILQHVVPRSWCRGQLSRSSASIRPVIVIIA